jgi:predicted RNA-binding Zn ribbon-like protein
MAPERQFQLIAGNLCLDFLNTLDDRGDPEREQELLTSYSDLIAFLRQSVALPEAVARKLLARSERDVTASARTLERARHLREAVHRIFAAILEKRMPPADDLDEFNSELTRLSKRLRLQPGTNGFEWQWAGDSGGDPSFDRVLWPILRSAVALLTSPDLQRVRNCESETCQWLFLDTSRNRSRRWCDMKVCGNRSKVRHFYQRHRAVELP